MCRGVGGVGLGLLALGLSAAGGCAGLGLGAGPLTAASADGSAVLATDLTTGVYVPVDENSADLYMTDLPISRLVDGGDALGDLSGNIVHVHLFLIPSAGHTPIDATASNIAIRHIVLSAGAVGIYGGGGFMMPGSEPGDATFSGSIQQASMRLLRRTSDFADRLGPNTIRGDVTAQRNDAAARAVAARIDRLIASAAAAPGAPSPTHSPAQRHSGAPAAGGQGEQPKPKSP